MQPFIILIRCKDSWIVFSEKGRGLKFVKRKWNIEYNNKEEVQFQTLCNAPGAGVKKKERAFHKKLKKAFNNLQYDESKQTTFCSVDHEFSNHA